MLVRRAASPSVTTAAPIAATTSQRPVKRGRLRSARSCSGGVTGFVMLRFLSRSSGPVSHVLVASRADERVVALPLAVLREDGHVLGIEEAAGDPLVAVAARCLGDAHGARRRLD